MSLLALAVVSTAGFARELRQPALKSQAALVVDQQSGEILLGKNMESKLPIASLTKLMTAIVTLDAELDPDEPVTITKADVDRLRGSHSRLQVGTTLTRDELQTGVRAAQRSEEHTSELQSQSNLVCRLLLEKKKKYTKIQRSCTTKVYNSGNEH